MNHVTELTWMRDNFLHTTTGHFHWRMYRHESCFYRCWKVDGGGHRNPGYRLRL